MGKDPLKSFLHHYLAFVPVLCLVLLSACNRGGERALETAYVSGVQAILRDHVAAVYEKTGAVSYTHLDVYKRQMPGVP